LRAGRGTAGKLLSDDALYNDTRAAIADLRASAEKINGVADDFRSITNDLQAGKGTAGKFLKTNSFMTMPEARLPDLILRPKNSI
jgi:phospholipid/cholesterol/gamma-HCH transport system substrate-binding protein